MSHCGYSLNELEPRLFSFNNPIGACTSCDGLGNIQYFEEDLVVQNPDFSLPGGAIKGWDRRNAYYYQLIQSLSDHYGFDIDTPFNELDAKIQKIILYGSAKKKLILFIYREKIIKLFVHIPLKALFQI